MDNKEIKREMIGKGVMGLFVGLSLIIVGILGGRQLHIVWNIWPSTDAVVERGAIHEILSVPYARGGLPIHTYSPEVEFRYTVGGKAYTTNVPSVNAADTYEKASANLARLYATGTHHPIRYNPHDPSDICFGTIDFSPLAFSFLLLVGGVVLSVAGLNSLVMAFLAKGEIIPAKEKRILSPVVSISERAGPEPSAATIYCVACGRPVKANEDTCPNCLKSLRAA